MNFKFTITAHGFEKAAALEVSLKKLGIPYEVEQAESAVTRRKKRAIVDKAALAVVVKCINDHPGWSDRDVARSTGIGSSTVNRIRNGVHCLQKKPLKAVK